MGSARAYAHQLKNPPLAVDRLTLFRKYGDFAEGSFDNCCVRSGSEEGVGLKPNANGSYPATGEYTSPVLKADFPFNELLPSWNVDAPKGANFHVYIRTSEDSKRWTTWYSMGWYVFSQRPQVALNDDFGWVDEDHILLNRPHRYYQYRITFFRGELLVSPVLRLFAVTYTNALSNKAVYEEFHRSIPKLDKKTWARSLPVPFRSQLWEDEKVRSSVCGPTTVAMILEFHDINVTTRELCEKCYDEKHRAFGLWPRHIQAAADYGLSGWIQRFRSWEAAQELVAQGCPIVASVKMSNCVISNAPDEWSGGHILIIRGFDANGDVLVNDPAWESEEKGVTTYKREELGRAWFDEGGVGCIYRPRAIM